MADQTGLFSPRDGDDPRLMSSRSGRAMFSPRDGDDPIDELKDERDEQFSPRDGDDPGESDRYMKMK